MLLAVLMVFALFGCAQSNDTEESANPDSTTTDDGSTPDDTLEPLTIVYMCSSFTIQWCQDIADTISLYKDSLNFELIESDSDNDNETFVTLVETYCDQEVDGFIMNAREDINLRVFEIIDEAGIPLLFESTRIHDENNLPLTSGVELNAYDCGAGCSTWVAENYEDYGFDYSDQSTLGFIAITYSSITSFVYRADGATETFQSYFPGCQLLCG